MMELSVVFNRLEQAAEALQAYMDANGGIEGIRQIAEQAASANPDEHNAISTYATPTDIANGITGTQANNMREWGLPLLHRATVANTGRRTALLSFLASSADVLEALVSVNEARMDYNRRVESRIEQLCHECSQRAAEAEARRAAMEPNALLERIAKLEAQAGITTE